MFPTATAAVVMGVRTGLTIGLLAAMWNGAWWAAPLAITVLWIVSEVQFVAQRNLSRDAMAALGEVHLAMTRVQSAVDDMDRERPRAVAEISK